MGAVYQARHRRLKRFVALKVLPAEKTKDAAAVARFQREMEAIGQLRHPNVIEAHDAGEDEGIYFLIVEYVAGLDLAAVAIAVKEIRGARFHRADSPNTSAPELASGVHALLHYGFPGMSSAETLEPLRQAQGREDQQIAETSGQTTPSPATPETPAHGLRLADACEITRQAALGLQHAHEHGLVHRDIKPSNLLLSNEGVVKVLDLGLALLHGEHIVEDLTSTGQVMGTIDYMAPEQIADTHRVDIRADIYSLGCTLFRLLSGKAPFAGPEFTTLFKKMKAHESTVATPLSQLRPDAPPELEALLQRMLAKDPAERFPLPLDVARAIEPFCAGANLPALLATAQAHQAAQKQRASDAPAAERPPLTHPSTLQSTIIRPPDQNADSAANVAVTAPRDEPFAIDSHSPTAAAAHQHDAPASGRTAGDNDHSLARRAGLETASRATQPLPTTSIDPQGSSRGAMTATLKRPFIAGAIVAVIVLGVLVPMFLNRTQRTTEDDRRMGTLARPSNGDEAAKPSAVGEEDGTGKSAHPTNAREPRTPQSDPDRAAAEWVLGRNGTVGVGVETLHDGQRHDIKQGEALPKEPFRIVFVQLVSTDVDSLSIKRELGVLKSVRFIALPHSKNVTDDVISTLSQLPNLTLIGLEETGVTADGVLAILSARPLGQLSIDSRQFTEAVAERLLKSPSIIVMTCYQFTDEQLRQVLRLQTLNALNVVLLPDGLARLRPSTWARLADALPQLRELHLDHVGIDDATAATLARLSNLDTLNLTRQPGLTDVGLESFATLPKLRHIDIRACPNITPLGLAALREAKPNCEVSWDGTDHRAVAEWGWSVGGKVRLAGHADEWLNVAITAPRDEPSANDAQSPKNSPTKINPANAPQGATDVNSQGSSRKVAVIAPRDEPSANDAQSPKNSPTKTNPANAPQGATDVNSQGSSRGAVTATLRGPLFLTGVDLSECRTIQDQDLARLADCSTIRTLDLHHTKLTGACLKHLRRRSRVGPARDSERRPTAAAGNNGNAAEDGGPALRLSHPTGLPRLEVLSLSGLPIKDDDLAALPEFPRLNSLNLHGTEVTDAGLPHVAKCSELSILSLNNTKVTNEGLKPLTALPKLFHLALMNCAVDDSVANVLMDLPAILSVELTNTGITDDTLRRLGERPSPKWGRLGLAGTKVTNAGLAALKDQTHLGQLECQGTQVAPPAFAEFVRQHPRLGMTMPTDESEAPDLRVARRVLAVGGTVTVVIAKPLVSEPLSTTINWVSQTITRLEDLPTNPFRIPTIDLRPADARVTDETVAEVGRLEMLSHFNTMNAKLADTAVVAIAAAPKLIDLNLTGTPLSEATARQIATRTDLTSLPLNDTKLDCKAAASLGALTKLTFLEIGSNTLTDDDIVIIEKLTDLETLSIGATQIVNRGWASIAKLPQLKQLEAYNMPVSDEALAHAGRIESLELLRVDGAASEVSDAGLKHLRSLLRLRDLHLNNCHRITDAGLESLAELPALETLDLSHTPITDTGLPHLARLKTLKSLNLTECKLSASAIDDLQDALPWCRIQR